MKEFNAHLLLIEQKEIQKYKEEYELKDLRDTLIKSRKKKDRKKIKGYYSQNLNNQ